MVKPVITTEYQTLSASLVFHKSLSGLWDSLQAVHALHDKDMSRGLLIYGASGEGKTHAVTQYKSQFPERKTPETTISPVFYFRMSESKKTVDDFLTVLIRELGTTPPKGRPQAGALFDQFKVLVKEKKIELFIIDEIQQVLPKTDGQRALEMVKFLCALIDCTELNTSFVFVGSERAMRLITYGEDGGTVDDNEQLSRRIFRPVRLTRLKPRSQEWVDCVNFFVQRIGLSKLTVSEDKDLFDRIYIAYTERSFSTLQDLFHCNTNKAVEDKEELLDWLAKKYALTGKAELNPFCPETLTAGDVDDFIIAYKQSPQKPYTH